MTPWELSQETCLQKACGVPPKARRPSVRSATRALLATAKPLAIGPELLPALAKALKLTSNPERIRRAMEITQRKVASCGFPSDQAELLGMVIVGQELD